MKEKFIQVGGRKVAYLLSGRAFSEGRASGEVLSIEERDGGTTDEYAGISGNAVFLLHGWGGSKESWKPLLDELGLDEVRCFVSVDFPGFGQSEEPSAGWDVGDYAHWFEHFVAAIYKSEQLSGDYDVIVHSFGGRVLLKLYAEDFLHNLEARPDKLVLIAAAGVKHGKSLRVRVATLAARVGKTIMKLPLLRRLAPLAQKILYKALRTHDYEKSSGVMRESFLKVIDEDLKESIEGIHRPTMIVWGNEDSYVPVKDAYMMHEKIAGSELHIIEGGRHGIHKTHAKQVAEWVKVFLKKLNG